jgi:polysaccharide biosynthesis transport protein
MMHGRVQIGRHEEIASATNDAPLDLRVVADFIRRRWLPVLATAIVFVGLAFLGLMTITPRYTAAAEVLLEPRKANIFGSEAVLPDISLDSSAIDSQMSVIVSINLLRRVVEDLKLTDDPEFGAPGGPGLLDTLKGYVMGLFPQEASPDTEADAAAPEQEAIPPDVLDAVFRLRESLAVSRVGREYVIVIAVTSETPEKAARLANAVADAFVVNRLNTRYEAAKRASAWLADRMEGLRGQLRLTEEAVARFRREHNLETVSSESKVTIGEQQLAELGAKLATARAETAERKAKYDQAQDVRAKGGNLESIPDVVRSSVISALRAQEAEVRRKGADLIARYSDEHPTVVNARAELRDIQRSISAEVQRILANLKNDYEVAQARETSLETSLNRMTGNEVGDSDVAIKLRELERANTANKTLYEDFLSRAKITREQSAFEEREAQIISPAISPVSPSYPRRKIVLLAALMFGLGVGVAGAMAADFLNSGFTGPKQIEAALGRPVLAAIPRLAPAERRIKGQVLDPVNFLLQKPLSRFSETVRSVRIGVQMADVDEPPKVLLVTSSVPAEGKSTLSTCLAYSSAKSGSRTLLIDGDLRHRSTTKYFKLEGQAGLVDVLAGSAELQDAIVDVGGVSVLAAGSETQNSADLLGSARMKYFMQALREEFEQVIIDSSPIAPVIDARVLAQLADKVIYVVRWQTTSREIVADCIGKIAADRNIAGIVLNIVNEKKVSRYGPNAYYSGERYTDYYES